ERVNTVRHSLCTGGLPLCRVQFPLYKRGARGDFPGAGGLEIPPNPPLRKGGARRRHFQQDLCRTVLGEGRGEGPPVSETAPHPNPPPGGRASPCADAVAPEGTEGASQNQRDSVRVFRCAGPQLAAPCHHTP